MNAGCQARLKQYICEKIFPVSGQVRSSTQILNVAPACSCKVGVKNNLQEYDQGHVGISHIEGSTWYSEAASLFAGGAAGTAGAF